MVEITIPEKEEFIKRFVTMVNEVYAIPDSDIRKEFHRQYFVFAVKWMQYILTVAQEEYEK